MSLGFGDRSRRRRRFWGRLARFLFLIAVILVFGVFMYQVGVDRAQTDLTGLRQKIAELGQANAEWTRERETMTKTLATLRQRAKMLQERYDREVPTGPSKPLVALVNQRLAAGVEPDRLAFVIGAAENLQQCDGPAQTKRFIVATPLYNGPNGAVGFADNTITVTASGMSARDDQGNPEAWYDTAEPVTVTFTQIGGEASEITGKLPLHHSIVLGDADYRFSLLEGARGFVKVVGERCSYP